MLLELTEKVNRMERKISEMDKRMIEGLNLSNETKYIKVIISLNFNVLINLI